MKRSRTEELGELSFLRSHLGGGEVTNGVAAENGCVAWQVSQPSPPGQKKREKLLGIVCRTRKGMIGELVKYTCVHGAFPSSGAFLKDSPALRKYVRKDQYKKYVRLFEDGALLTFDGEEFGNWVELRAYAEEAKDPIFMTIMDLVEEDEGELERLAEVSWAPMLARTWRNDFS